MEGRSLYVNREILITRDINKDLDEHFPFFIPQIETKKKRTIYIYIERERGGGGRERERNV